MSLSKYIKTKWLEYRVEQCNAMLDIIPKDIAAAEAYFKAVKNLAEKDAAGIRRERSGLMIQLAQLRRR